MKMLIVIALTYLASSANAEFTCDDCLSFAGKLGGYLQSAGSIEEQIEILVASVCPLLDDPAGCETGVRTWWEGIGLAMYPVFLEANSVCELLGACGQKSVVKAPTCDECTGSIAAVAGVIESADKIAEIIEFLKGDGFCVGTGAAEGCGVYIDAFMPAAMPVLAGVLTDRAETYCCELSDEGICC